MTHPHVVMVTHPNVMVTHPHVVMVTHPHVVMVTHPHVVMVIHLHVVMVTSTCCHGDTSNVVMVTHHDHLLTMNHTLSSLLPWLYDNVGMK